ncbi:proline racemase family protein [Shouchella lonarensis]|nr:proline racemase family protein [Shouchella lonarensis]
MRTEMYAAATDIHVAGEMFRVVSWRDTHCLQVKNLADYQDMMLKDVSLRRTMREPRGHKDMYLCVLTPPVSEKAQAGVVIMNVSGACRYHAGAYVAVATYLMEVEGKRKDVMQFDGLTGRIEVMIDRQSRHYTIRELIYEMDDSGRVVTMDEVIQVEKTSLDLSVDMLTHVREAWLNARRCYDPFDLLFLYNERTFLTVTNAGHIDRSPLSGAMVHAQLKKQDGMVSIQNFLGHEINGERKDHVLYLYPHAFVVGLMRFVVDPEDPLKEGFWIE